MSTSPAHTEPTGLVREGDVLAGKYRVEHVLGAGGMGIVLAATHLELEEKVAIKLLLPAATKSPTLVNRFTREARASAKIKSEHVARVHDVGTLESGTPYMVMEYLSGSDLSHMLESSGPLQVAVAVDYVLQACEALAEAHAVGIIHRDLKPANMFLTRRADSSPCVKVLDFGISKITTSSDPRITDTTAVMGSPFYMSPEQLKASRDVDARTDIWSLGVILFELLAGTPPFDRETMPQLCLAIMQDAPAVLTTYRHDVPPALEAVISKCLEKSADKRFRSVGELADALVPFVSGRARLSAERASEISRTKDLTSRPTQISQPALAMSQTQHAHATSQTMLSTSPSWGGTLPPNQRQMRLAIVLVGVVLSLVAGTAAVYWAVRTPSTREMPESAAAAALPPLAQGSQSAAPTVSAAATPAPDNAAKAVENLATTAVVAPKAAVSKPIPPRAPATVTPPPRPGRTAPRPPPHPPIPPLPPPQPNPPPPAQPNLFDDRK